MSQIGGYTLFQLETPPPPTVAQLLVQARAGIDGNAFFNTGRRGVQFQTRSLSFHADLSAAMLAYTGFRAMVSANGVNVKWANFDLPERYKVLMVDFVPGSPKRVAFGLQTYPTRAIVGARLECTWTLMAIAE